MPEDKERGIKIDYEITSETGEKQICSKKIDLLKEGVIGQVISLIYGTPNNNGKHDKKVGDFFENKIRNIILQLFNKEVNGKSETNKALLEKFNNGDTLNEKFHTKFNRYYPMYEEYIIKRFKTEIEKSTAQNISLNYVIKVIRGIIDDFAKVLYIYGDTLSPSNFETIFLDTIKLEETYKNTIKIYEIINKYPDLIEMYRHISNQGLNSNGVSIGKAIENHFESTFDSLMDLFIHWINTPSLDKEGLNMIVKEIKNFQNYFFILNKNNLAFGINKIKRREQIESFYRKQIQDKLNTNHSYYFTELFQKLNKLVRDEKMLDIFINDIKMSRIKDNKIIPENAELLNIPDVEQLMFSDISNTNSNIRIKLFVNRVLNIGSYDDIKIINPFENYNKRKKLLNDFSKFYCKKHKKYNLSKEEIVTMLYQGILTITDKIKKEGISEQKEKFLNIIEKDNELIQIVISWWRYTLMHKEFNGNEKMIKNADQSLYGTKELILSKLKGVEIGDLKIVNGDQVNGSAWPLQRMIGIHKKRFTHGPININNEEKFGLGEKGLIKDHLPIYTINEFSYNKQISNELFKGFKSELSKKERFNKIGKKYDTFINIVITNELSTGNGEITIRNIIDSIKNAEEKNLIIGLLKYLINFLNRNEEIYKLKKITKVLKNRMEICNSLLSKETDIKETDDDFTQYLEQIGIIPNKNTSNNKFDLDGLRKIRRYLKYIVKISKDLENMLSKGERDRLNIEELLNKTGLKNKIGKNNTISIGPRKSISRLIVKLMENYNGDLREIGDITRMRITSKTYLESIEAIKDFILNITNGLDVTQIVIEDNTGNPLERGAKPTGYRDIALKIRLDSKNIIEVQFVLEPIAEFKNGLKASELVGLYKEYNIDFSDSDFNELISQSLRLNKQLPEELKMFYKGDIIPEVEKHFRKGLILSSDDFYDLWRESKNKNYVKKMQYMESLPNKEAWAKIVREILEKLLI